jgi:hypothetical protein
MANPTPAEFKARYVWAASVADATVQAYLDEAAADLGPESCWGAAWPRAVMLLAAHRMTTEGLNPGAQGASLAAGGMQSVRSGTLSLTVADWASSGGYGSTQYGQELLALGKRYRGVGPMVVGGCGAGGGTSGYAKDAPLAGLPSGYGGQ